MDVIIVKMMLHFALKLPAEVVLSIFDFAEYWPHTTAELDQSMVIQAGGGRENQFLVREHTRSSLFHLNTSGYPLR